MRFRKLIQLKGTQFAVLSAIARDIAQVFFASMVVSPFLVGVDRINWIIVLSGGILSLIFWFLSTSLVKKGGRK